MEKLFKAVGDCVDWPLCGGINGCGRYCAKYRSVHCRGLPRITVEDAERWRSEMWLTISSQIDRSGAVGLQVNGLGRWRVWKDGMQNATEYATTAEAVEAYNAL